MEFSLTAPGQKTLMNIIAIDNVKNKKELFNRFSGVTPLNLEPTSSSTEPTPQPAG